MKIIKSFGKFLLAGITASAIISIILCVYSLTPIHIENPEKNTDYIWEPNSRWITMTEGIGGGKYDANGYNNVEVIENPEIIIVGSSHVEGRNVTQKENMSYLLNEMFEGKHEIYNMGISGHHFYKTCQYLPASLDRFEVTPKLVLVESAIVELSKDQVEAAINGTVEFSPSHSEGLVALLQKIPFLRVFYSQIEDGLFDLFLPELQPEIIVTPVSEGTTEPQINVDEEAYELMFDYLASIEEEYDTEIVIFFHPEEVLEEDGTISFKNNQYASAFASAASQNGIDFIDMASYFETMYYEEHKVPHGFITGKAAYGHMNADGHSAIADVLYDVITKMEEQ